MAVQSDSRVARSATSDGQHFSTDELQELRESLVLMTGSKDNPCQAEERRAELQAELAEVARASAELDEEDRRPSEAQEDRGAEEHSAELARRRTEEQSLSAKLRRIEAETQQLRAQKAKKASQEASQVAKLRQELDEAATRLSRTSSSQMGAPSSAALKAVAELAEVSRAASETRASFEKLEEEQAALQEEVGTLRFSIKDVKSFQHKRAQELDNQVKKLEKQRRRLQEDQSAKAQSETEVSAAEAQVASTQAQLDRVQQLNRILSTQAADVDKQREKQEREEAEALAEYRELEESASAGQNLRTYNDKLDEMSELEGSLRRKIRELRNQVQQRQRHVQCLEKTANQTKLQLEEAETANGRLKVEQEASERRAEIFRWKLELVESLQKPRKKKPQPAVKESGASSSAESPSGAREARRDSNQASAGATSAGSDDGFDHLICARCSSDPSRLRTQEGCPLCEARVAAIRSDAESSV